jgi:hypothetical protein
MFALSCGIAVAATTGMATEGLEVVAAAATRMVAAGQGIVVVAAAQMVTAGREVGVVAATGMMAVGQEIALVAATGTVVVGREVAVTASSGMVMAGRALAAAATGMAVTGRAVAVAASTGMAALMVVAAAAAGMVADAGYSSGCRVGVVLGGAGGWGGPGYATCDGNDYSGPRGAARDLAAAVLASPSGRLSRLRQGRGGIGSRRLHVMAEKSVSGIEIRNKRVQQTPWDIDTVGALIGPSPDFCLVDKGKVSCQATCLQSGDARSAMKGPDP